MLHFWHMKQLRQTNIGIQQKIENRSVAYSILKLAVALTTGNMKNTKANFQRMQALLNIHAFNTYGNYFAIVVLFIFLSSTAFAQSFICGTVSKSNGLPLEGANVYLENTYDGTSSAADGTFGFKSDANGKRILHVEFIGFETYIRKIDLPKDTLHFSISLNEVFNELNAISISAGTFAAGDKMKSIAITALDMVTTAGASGDLYAALQALPGTTTVGESGRLYVKGGDSRESKTYIDGNLVLVPYTSSAPQHSVRSRFNPFMFSGTTFTTGGYSAEYGQALSSVLSLKTNEMSEADQVNISVLSVGSDFAATKSWSKASVTASAGYTNLAPYMALVPQYTQWQKTPETRKGEMSFRLKTPKSGLLKVFTSLSASQMALFQNNLNLPGSQNSYGLRNNNAYVNTFWSGQLKEGWILNAGYAYTNNSDDVQLDTVDYNTTTEGGHAKLMLKHQLCPKIKVKLGSELYSKTYGVRIASDKNNEKYTYTNNTGAAFVEGEIYASKKWVTRLGVRFENSSYLHHFTLSPRLSTAYQLPNKHQISLSYGWFYQDPADDFLLRTSNLSFERANHYTINYMVSEKKRTLRSEVFYKDYSSLVKYASANNEALTLNNNGYGYAYGFDLFWRDKQSIRNGDYWISYSYIDAKRNYLNYPYEAIPGYTSKHNLTLVYKHWLGHWRSQLGATYSLSSPRVYNNPNAVEFNNEKAIPYQSLDFNWSYLYRSNIIFYASASNLLGFKQEFGKKYASSANSEGEYASTPILPGAKRFFVVGCFITLSKKGDLNQLDTY